MQLKFQTLQEPKSSIRWVSSQISYLLQYQDRLNDDSLMNNSLFCAFVLKQFTSPWIKAVETPQLPLTGSPLNPASPCSPGCPGSPGKPLNDKEKKCVTV